MKTRLALFGLLLSIALVAASCAPTPWERPHETKYRTVSDIKAQHLAETAKGKYYLKLMNGDPATKSLALTFDDGPHPIYTKEILAILNKYNIKATFFVVGKMAEQYPDLIRRENAAGHIVGNHTYSHLNLTRLSPDEIRAEVLACDYVIYSALGKNPVFFRPPGGDYNDKVISNVTAEKLTTVLWTDDPGDYASPGETVIAKRLFKDISNGGIILLHDGVQQTLDLLPGLIEKLQDQGYKFVTVKKMMK